MTHPQFRLKLEAAGFGVFIPIFFVTSGLRFDLGALFSSASTVARVPIFLLALVVVRGLPALLYRSVADGRHMVTAGLLQATSLPFIVTATDIDVQLNLIGKPSAAAFITAGLLSVVVFPAAGLSLLRGAGGKPARDVGGHTMPTQASPVLSVEERLDCRREVSSSA